MKFNIFKRLICVSLIFLSCIGIGITASSGAEVPDYDGYSFNTWVNRSGYTRGTKLSQVNSTIFVDMYGTGANGARFTFESDGNGAYYIHTTFRYLTTYLRLGGTNSNGDYYLGGTTAKSSALKWRFESDGLLHTTINSKDYVIWFPINVEDYGFRLTTDTSDYYAVSYRAMTLTPPETPHTHPICGSVCEHTDVHDTLSALQWSGGGTSAYGILDTGDYYLTKDISISQNITISSSADVRICLNGHSIEFTNGHGFEVYGNLELCDCQGTGSVNSSPRKESGYYVFDNKTILIGSSGSAVFYGGSYCEENGCGIVNQGTLSAYNANFKVQMNNSGTATFYDCNFNSDSLAAVNNYGGGDLTLYDCSAESTAHYALCNGDYTGTVTVVGGTFHTSSSNSYYSSVCNWSTMSIDGAEISSDSTYGIKNNAGTLTLLDGTVSGSIAVWNGSGRKNTDENGGICKVLGGVLNGSECDILNTAKVSTVTAEETETTYVSKGILEISGTPSIDKIVLEYPDTFTFDYSGTTPIDLEVKIGDDFAEGDVVFSGSSDKIDLLNLLNTGYGLEAEGEKVVLTKDDPCSSGHDHVPVVTPPTCTDPGYTTYTCSRCGDCYTADEVPASHTISQGEAQTKTCTQDGWEAYEYCTACDYTTKVVIPAGHVIAQGEAQAKTCTQDGWEAYEYCTACDYTTKVVIPTLGHTYEYGLCHCGHNVLPEIICDKTNGTVTLKGDLSKVNSVIISVNVGGKMIYCTFGNGTAPVAIPASVLQQGDCIRVFYLDAKFAPVLMDGYYELKQK